MLREQTGISQVQKLYLQMLFRCNFNCQHCFHGEKLREPDRFSADEAERAILMFLRDFGLKNVTLLGGEPFIHPDLERVLRFSKQHGLETAVCTNGYRIGKILTNVQPYLDLLRVSLEGIGKTHDEIRRPGSFTAALETLRLAQQLNISSSVTMTITTTNVGQVAELARIIEGYGVTILKLHQLRLVGNAKEHPELLCDGSALKILAEQIQKANQIGISVLLDDDLDFERSIIPGNLEMDAFELERVEIQPDGAMYVSCKAVGSNSNAFWLDKGKGEILYRPTSTDELVTNMPQVHYARV